MNRLQKAAILTTLADVLRREGSWCGETHIQKATYFLQELLEVPLGYDFILYKHGPFSFSLRDELTALRSDGLLEMRARGEGYGPSLIPTAASEDFRKRYALTLGSHGRAIDFVARALADKGVADLERLATALFVMREKPDGDAEARARRINELKPHVSLDEARAAVGTVDRVSRKAAALGAE